MSTKDSETARVPVSLRALIQRINRKLADDDRSLRTARGGRARFDLGDYYVIDVKTNALLWKDVDPETLGQELGVLKKWECVI